MPVSSARLEEFLATAQGLAYNSAAFPMTVSDMHDQMDNGTLRQFHVRQFPAGHNPTNYPKLRQTSNINLNTYQVKYSNNYEPFLLFNKLTTPKYVLLSPENIWTELGRLLPEDLILVAFFFFAWFVGLMRDFEDDTTTKSRMFGSWVS